MYFRSLALLTLLPPLALAQPADPTPPLTDMALPEAFRICTPAVISKMESSGMDENEVFTTYPLGLLKCPGMDDYRIGRDEKLCKCLECKFWATVQALPAYATGKTPEEVTLIYNEAKTKCDRDGVPGQRLVARLRGGVVTFILEADALLPPESKV